MLVKCLSYIAIYIQALIILPFRGSTRKILLYYILEVGLLISCFLFVVNFIFRAMLLFYVILGMLETCAYYCIFKIPF